MVEERWTNNRRSDGCEIMMGVDGWVIMPGSEGLPVARCPCCDKIFPGDDKGLRSAKLVADALYPMKLATDQIDDALR
jgi:hypothetical protein